MPRFKITDGDRTVEAEDKDATLAELFIVVADCLDHHGENYVWMPRDYREQLAKRSTCA